MLGEKITIHSVGDLDLWLAWLIAGGLAEGTIRNRRHYLRQFLAGVPDPWLATLDDLVAFLSGHDWKPETRKSARAALRSFYAWGHLSGRIDHDPSLHLPKVRVPAGVARPAPELILVDAMLRASRQELLMLCLAGYMGLRLHEVAKVHSRDVTLHGLRVTGKGGKVRIVPLHEYVAGLLEQVDGWAFESPLRPGRHVGVDYVGRRVSRLLGPGWSTHTLRHRFATRAYAASHDQFAVQRLLGHSKPETTARYVAVAHEDLAAAVNGVT